MTLSRVIAATVAFALVALVACSSDDASPSSSSSGGGTSGSTPDGGGTPDGSSGAVPEAGTDAPPAGGQGIQLTAAGTSYSLTDNPSAAPAGNGWLIGAATIDGTKMRNLAIILNKAEPGPKYVPLTPGTYPCTMPGAAPFTWARFQYVTPDGTTYQSPSSATCSATLTDFGEVGQPVKGSFSATLDRVVGSEATTVAITGTFDVVRKD